MFVPLEVFMIRWGAGFFLQQQEPCPAATPEGNQELADSAPGQRATIVKFADGSSAVGR
jgi:hypothetical protein